MNDATPPDGPVRPSRVERAAHARSTRRGVAWGVAAALVVAGLGVYLVNRGGGDSPAVGSGGEGPAKETSATLALQVNGAPAPMLAVVGVPARGRGFFMPLSSELTVVVPGQGETSAAGVAALPADSMRIALSNMSGLWIDDYAVLSLRDLAAAVDDAGGVIVDLPDSYPTTTGSVGALLADPPPLVSTGEAEIDDVDAVNATLADAAGAEALDMPTERVTSTIVVPVYPALDELLSDALGTPMPVPTIVQNGSGEPGVGETVAERIIPAGFRVVLSQNAPQGFHVPRTDILANGPDHETEARAVEEALGVGRVRVAAVPSNVGDITIVVGKDFAA
jgi:hypothetical protein